MNNNTICLVNVHCLPFVFTTLTQTVQKNNKRTVGSKSIGKKWLVVIISVVC